MSDLSQHDNELDHAPVAVPASAMIVPDTQIQTFSNVSGGETPENNPPSDVPEVNPEPFPENNPDLQPEIPPVETPNF